MSQFQSRLSPDEVIARWRKRNNSSDQLRLSGFLVEANEEELVIQINWANPASRLNIPVSMVRDVQCSAQYIAYGHLIDYVNIIVDKPSTVEGRCIADLLELLIPTAHVCVPCQRPPEDHTKEQQTKGAE